MNEVNLNLTIYKNAKVTFFIFNVIFHYFNTKIPLKLSVRQKQNKKFVEKKKNEFISEKSNFQVSRRFFGRKFQDYSNEYCRGKKL